MVPLKPPLYVLLVRDRTSAFATHYVPYHKYPKPLLLDVAETIIKRMEARLSCDTKLERVKS